MNVLIVEDDTNKIGQLTHIMKDLLPDVVPTIKRSLQSGLRSIRTSVPDLVLLDMTLPTYDVGPDEPGGNTHPLGGREFLGDMKRFSIVAPVIVVTQFETFGSGPETTTLQALDAELRRDYQDIYRGAVYYHASIQSWKDRLRTLIKEAVA